MTTSERKPAGGPSPAPTALTRHRRRHRARWAIWQAMVATGAFLTSCGVFGMANASEAPTDTLGAISTVILVTALLTAVSVLYAVQLLRRSRR